MSRCRAALTGYFPPCNAASFWHTASQPPGSYSRPACPLPCTGHHQAIQPLGFQIQKHLPVSQQRASKSGQKRLYTLQSPIIYHYPAARKRTDSIWHNINTSRAMTSIWRSGLHRYLYVYQRKACLSWCSGTIFPFRRLPIYRMRLHTSPVTGQPKTARRKAGNRNFRYNAKPLCPGPWWTSPLSKAGFQKTSKP